MNIVFDEDKLVEYPFTNLDELDLAYAITVHKVKAVSSYRRLCPYAHSRLCL